MSFFFESAEEVLDDAEAMIGDEIEIVWFDEFELFGFQKGYIII